MTEGWPGRRGWRSCMRRRGGALWAVTLFSSVLNRMWILNRMWTCGAQVGVAFLDAAARRLGACEFADDEHFCSLEAVLLQLGVKEVVLPKARRTLVLLPGALPSLLLFKAVTSCLLWRELHSRAMRQRRKRAHAAVQDAEGATQSADGARLRDVVARCAAMGSERPRAAYATRNLEQVCLALRHATQMHSSMWAYGMCYYAADNRCSSCVFT